MGSFLDYGGSLPMSEVEKRGPLEVNTDPRGRTADGFLGLLEEERNREEAELDHWENMAQEGGWSKANYLAESIFQESLTGNAIGLAEDYAQEFDPAFDPTEFVNDEMPDWQKEAVADAKNAKHAQILLERTERQKQYEMQGQYHGAVGTALQFAGGLISPETWALGGAELGILTKLGIAGGKRIATGAAIGALSNAGQEAVIVANNKSRDEFGIALAAGFGAGFGAIGSVFDVKALAKQRKLDEMIGKDFSGAIKNDLDIATGDIKVKTTHTQSPDSKLWSDAVDRGEAGIDIDGSYVVSFGDTLLKYDTKAQAVAAERLRARKIEPTPKAVEVQVEEDYLAEAARYDKLVPKRKGVKGASLGLQGRSSENPFTRFMYNLLTEDASGTGGKQVATHSGALRADMYAHQMRSLWHTTRHKMTKQWARETGQRSWLPWDNSMYEKFDDAVIKEVGYRRIPESRPKGQQVPDSISMAADQYSELQKLRLNRMKQSGVEGYDTLDPDNLYIKHKWDGVAMSRLAAKGFDKEFIVNLIKNSILAGGEFKRMHKYGRLGEKLTDDYKAKTAHYMATAIYDRFTRRPDTVNMARAGWVTKKDTLDLRKRVESIVDDPEAIKHIMNAVDGRDARAVNEVLTQIDLDVNFEIDGLSVRNLLDNDLGAGMDTEIRRSAGKAAMADMGFKSQDEYMEFAEKANRWSRENLSMPEKELEQHNQHNFMLWNLVMGENLESNANSGLANAARGFRKAATLASLNQVGFAQAAETGRLTGAIGVRQFMRQIPEYGRMIRDMKSGRFKDPMLNDIEDAFGVRLGDNEILNHPMNMAEAGGVGITANDGKTFLAGLDTAMNKGLHVQGYINGMNYIMKAQHRMHARGFMSNLWRDLQKAELAPRRVRRYADMGLGAEDLKAIKAEFDKNVEMGEGWFGQQRPVNMNLVKMSPEIREKLALSFWKNQAQTVQRTMGGESAWWMEGTAGKLFSQFRTFPIVAIEKQTLHDLKHIDVESFTTLSASLGFASLAYTAKTYANSFGLPTQKRKKYLKNRLSAEKIAAGAASWAGQANILPDMMRTAGDFGIDNPFQWTYQKGQAYRDYYRERSLDLGAIGPAGAMINSAYRFATGVGQAVLTPAEFRADTFKNIVRIAPYGNNLLIKSLQNAALE